MSIALICFLNHNSLSKLTRLKYFRHCLTNMLHNTFPERRCLQQKKIKNQKRRERREAAEKGEKLKKWEKKKSQVCSALCPGRRPPLPPGDLRDLGTAHPTEGHHSPLPPSPRRRGQATCHLGQHEFSPVFSFGRGALRPPPALRGSVARRSRGRRIGGGARGGRAQG